MELVEAALISWRGDLGGVGCRGSLVLRIPVRGPRTGQGGGRCVQRNRAGSTLGPRRALWNRASFFSPLCQSSHKAVAHAGDVWPPTLKFPAARLRAPTLRHPSASFLRNPDGSKVCHAAESPGLGPLGAPALQTGGVGWGDRLTGQSRICQGCPPHTAGTRVKYSISTHLCALEGCVSETESLVWPVLSACQYQALGVRNEGDLFL